MAHRPTDQIVGAIQDFQDSLTTRQNADFFASYGSTIARHNGVSVFIAQLDLSSQRRTFRCLASRMQGTLQSVEQFSKVVDNFVPSRPPIGPLVRGILRYTIELSSNYASFFEILSEWFTQVHAYCPKLREYEFIYRDSFRLQEALCSFYAILIDFCTHAVHNIGQCGTVQHGKSFWTPVKQDFSDYAALLQRRYRDVKDEEHLAYDQAEQRDDQLRVAEKQKADEASKYPRILRLKFDRLVGEDRAWKRQVQVRNARIRIEVLLDKLSKHDYVSALNRERKKRYGSTAMWLPKTRQFQDWLVEEGQPCFWLSGPSGSGKTVMTTALIDSLLIRRGHEAVGVAYFFCQYNNAESLKARALLGSLTRQCLAEDGLPASHETYLDQILADEPLNVEDMKAFLLKIISDAAEEQVIVIDGLDEMALDQRGVVLAVLRHLSVSAKSRIKIFISSRHSVGKEIEIALPKPIHQSLSCEFVNKDVVNYIKLALVEKAEFGSLHIGDNAVLPIIEEMLIEKCNGSFLWAFFQIEELCTRSNDEDIYKSLAALPKDLPETFRRALRRITRHNRETATSKIFFWAAVARRPLTLLEMREAIAIHEGQRVIRESQLVTDADSVISWCCGLLVLDEEEQVVRFAHHTVRDYLFSASEDSKLACFHFQIDRIDRDAGKACCNYLSLDDFNKPLIEPTRSRSLADSNGIRESLPKVNGNANGNGAIAKAQTTLDRIRKARPSLGNILQIMQDPSLETSSPEQLLSPIRLPKQPHPFLKYAREFWLYHTSTIREDDSHLKAWKRLVLASNTLAPKPWTWASRMWSEPEDPNLLKAIVNLNHGALLDFVIEMHLAQTQYLPSSPKFRSITLYIAQHGSLALLYRLLQWESSIPFSLWGDSFDAAVAGGQVHIMEALLRPDSWDDEPLRFTSRGTRLDIMDSNITSKPAQDRIRLAKIRLQHTGPLAGLKTLMKIEAEKEGTAVGYLELLEACKDKDEAFVERILATGVDPRMFPRHEYRAIRAVMKEKGEL